MQSAFNNPSPPTSATTNAAADESYNLLGLNMRDPDEIMPPGETPYTINSRMYARNGSESRVANRTRMGCSFLTDAIGSTQNVSNTATNTGDLAFSTTRIIAFPIIPTSTGALTSLALEIKKIGSATGHVMIELYANNAGVPGTTVLAQSAIYSTGITTTYQFLKAYFTDAPTLSNGITYWAVVYIQDNGSGSYYLSQTASGAVLDLVSVNDQVAWTTLNVGVNFKSYLSTVGGIKGYTSRYPQDSTQNLILFVQSNTLYSCSISTGTPNVVDNTVNASATKVRFDQGMNNTYYVDGYSGVKQWTGTGAITQVPNVPSSNPTNILIWQNRMFIMTGNRIDFSELGDYTTWPSTNFFYIPITTPQAADHPTGWGIFQNNLIVFTHLTKYMVVGSNIANFTYKEVVGTKGCVSQEALAIDRSYCYFLADDGQVYRWAGSGSDDELLSDKVQPELQTIQDRSQVRFHIYRNQLRIYYNKAPNAHNGNMLLYDVELTQWFMDTGRNMAGSLELYLDDNQLVEFSSLVGMLVYGETQFSDLGKSLDYQYFTNYKTYGYKRRTGQAFGGASAKKRIKRFRPIIRTADADYTMLIGKDMNFANNPDLREYIVSGGGAKWGSFRFGDGTLWGKAAQIQNAAGMSGRGFYIQYRFLRQGVETPVELYGYVALYKIGTQK